MKGHEIMSDYKSNLIKCPFYKEETKNTIRCEGIVSEALQNNFRETKNKKIFRKRFCCNNYEKCPLFQSINSKYI